MTPFSRGTVGAGVWGETHRDPANPLAQIVTITFIALLRIIGRHSS
jgi:hypothetical protein